MVKSVKTHLKKHKPVGATNIHRSISEFLITYQNVPHTTTGLAPAHLVLAQAPCTHLSMTATSVYQRVKLQLQPTQIKLMASYRPSRLGTMF